MDLTDQLRDCGEGIVSVSLQDGRRWPQLVVAYTATQCTYTETARIAYKAGTSWLDGWSWSAMAAGETHERQGTRLVEIARIE